MRAYDYYLKARVIVDSPNSGADLQEALAYCDRAISIDPSYARAYACKALTYIACNWVLELGDIKEWREQALHYGEQAVALDPMDGVSHWALGEATFYLKQSDRCRSHMARSLALNPNDADVLAVSSFLQTACGDSSLGLLHMQMARERNPSHPPWYHWIAGGALYMMGRYDEALASLDLFGRPNASVLRWRAITLVQLGRIDEARADVQSLLALRPGLSLAKMERVFDYLPDAKSYVDCLRKAGLPE
jgi:tetratricopeptide (TPR) repeat protein